MLKIECIKDGVYKLKNPTIKSQNDLIENQRTTLDKNLDRGMNKTLFKYNYTISLGIS